SGSGTYVAGGVEPPEGTPAPAGPGHQEAPRLARMGAYAQSVWTELPLHENVPFNLGVSSPDPRTVDFLRRIGQRNLARLNETHRGYGHVQGLPELREHISRYLGASRSVRCTADQIFIVSGAHQALDLALR